MPFIVIPKRDMAEHLWLQSQLQSFERYILQKNKAETLHREPRNPQEGQIVIADGTDWDPTSDGGGFYGFRNGTWEKL